MQQVNKILVSPLMSQKKIFFFFFRGGNLHRHLNTHAKLVEHKVVPDSYRLKPPRAEDQ